MQRVFVLNTNKQPLMPCHPARARELLRRKKAAVYRKYPFTIILNYAVESTPQSTELKVDPGSKTTGIALVAHLPREKEVIWAGNLNHRGQSIKLSLDQRRAIRRNRRNRKTHYRIARFNNRRRPEGWLPPSLQSRVDNTINWIKKLYSYAPIHSIAVETVRFDTQKMLNPEISGVEYQQGELQDYEVREYLLEKWKRKCSYCDIDSVPLEVEHIVPKKQGWN